MAHFLNKSPALAPLVLIPIFLSSSNDGKRAFPRSRSCTGNWWPMGTRKSTTPSTDGLSVPFQKGRRSDLLVPCQENKRSKRLLIGFHVLLCLHDRRCSFSFVGLKTLWLRIEKC